MIFLKAKNENREELRSVLGLFAGFGEFVSLWMWSKGKLKLEVDEGDVFL